MAAPVVRLTANVTPEVADKLDRLAEILNTSKTEALNQAIATAATLYEQSLDGGRVQVKKGNVTRDVNMPVGK